MHIHKQCFNWSHLSKDSAPPRSPRFPYRESSTGCGTPLFRLLIKDTLKTPEMRQGIDLALACPLDLDGNS